MAATTLLTSDQFLALPEEFDNTIRYELVCGELVATPPSSQQDAIIRSNLLEALITYGNANLANGLMVLSRATFVISMSSVSIPDVSLISISRLTGNEKYIQGAPELAIEVVSPSQSAAYLRIKTEAYLANGSHSVWIVFPEVRSVMVYTSDSLRELKGDQTITDPLLPGFSCPVAAFFKLT